MYSRGHALVSLVLAGAILAVAPAPVHPLIVVAVVVGVGVGIDVDHFALALLNAGTTRPIRRVLRRPRIAVLDQDDIFDDTDLTHTQRLLSHALLGGVAVGGLWPVSRYWALVVGVTIYVHVLADLVADVRAEKALDRAPRI